MADELTPIPMGPTGPQATPTQAARSEPPKEPERVTKATEPRVYVVPYGVPFYQAALWASQHGYTELRWPDPATGQYASYPIGPAAVRGYARAGGITVAAAAEAGDPTRGRPTPAFLGRGGQSIPPMGGSASSLIATGLRPSPLHDAGSGSVWATSPLHAGPAGGVAPSERVAGGPEQVHRLGRLAR